MDVAASAAANLGLSAAMVEIAHEATASSSPALVATEPIARLARSAPVIVVLPLAARPRTDRSLRDLVAQELRSDAGMAAAATAPARGDERDEATAGLMSGGDDGDGGDEAVDVDRAVVAMHDERIAFLKQRIAAFVAQRRAVAQIGFLRARLQRAEAARRVAAVRSGLEGAAGKRSERLTASTAPLAQGRPTLYPHAAFRFPAAPRQGLVEATRYVPAWIAPAAAAAERVVDVDRADRHLTATTHHIRRLLATARQALSDEQFANAAGGSVHPARPVRIAGLLRWEGSDSWSLADCVRSRA